MPVRKPIQPCGTPGGCEQKQLMAHEQRRKENQSEPRGSDNRASRYTSAHEQLDWWIYEAGDTEKKHEDANPYNPAE